MFVMTTKVAKALSSSKVSSSGTGPRKPEDPSRKESEKILRVSNALHDSLKTNKVKAWTT